MKTEVCISVDVEYSIGGAFSWPDQFKPLSNEVVDCMVAGREQGLGFILDSLNRFGMLGTFFTEALQTTYFGDEPMARTANRIVAAGQDLQLHLHPCWLHFRDDRWMRPGFVPNDYCSGRTDEQLDEMLRLGIEAFARWGVPKPVALRTGGFRTDDAVYSAMARMGMPLASNISLGVFSPKETQLQVSGGRHLVNGVLEVPALSYRSPKIHLPTSSAWRSTAITATSSSEMEALLWQARKTGCQTVIVLTHPHEFIKQRGFRYDNLQVNQINQSRFLHLLNFVHCNSADFTTVSFATRQSEWLKAGTVSAPVLKTSLRNAVFRSFENVLNDHL